MKRERGKAAALIEGVLSRQSELYALSDDEYGDGRPTGPASFSSQNPTRGSRLKHRRVSGGSHDRRNGDDAFRKVEEYIESNTYKSVALWSKVKSQILDKQSEVSQNGASDGLNATALPVLSTAVGPDRAIPNTSGIHANGSSSSNSSLGRQIPSSSTERISNNIGNPNSERRR